MFMRFFLLFFCIIGLLVANSCLGANKFKRGLFYQYIDEDDEIVENAYDICYDKKRTSDDCKIALHNIGHI